MTPPNTGGSVKCCVLWCSPVEADNSVVGWLLVGLFVESAAPDSPGCGRVMPGEHFVVRVCFFVISVCRLLPSPPDTPSISKPWLCPSHTGTPPVEQLALQTSFFAQGLAAAEDASAATCTSLFVSFGGSRSVQCVNYTFHLGPCLVYKLQQA